MDSADLTAEQLAALAACVAGHADYLSRLHARTAELGFPAADPVGRAARRADDAVGELVRLVGDLRRRAELPTWAGGTRKVEPKPRSRRGRRG